MDSDGSTLPKFLKWLNFGAVFHAGVVHDEWLDRDKHVALGVLVYSACLLWQLILLAVFIIPLTVGLFIYECSPLALKTWLRKSTDRPL